MMRRTRASLLAALLPGAMVILTACGPGSDPEITPTPTSSGRITRYVAMGDSFVAGPSIEPQASGTNVCLRSTANYPHLLAKELDIPELIDVSCAGASTYHLLNDVPAPGETVRAQVDALSTETKLVTIGIGYNNDLYFTNLLASCMPSPALKAGACGGFVDDKVPGLLRKAHDSVLDALETIRREAPNAKVILVGYLPLLPEPDACPAKVVDPQNERRVYDAEADTDATLRATAQDAGVEFVSMRKLGRGHGMCAGDDAWVNGATAAPGDGVVVHPRAVGMEAVADALAAKLRTGKG